MITLYQFPISHYCEKIRWTLDYKGIEYQLYNLMPGLHILKTKKLAPLSSVPIIQHDNKVIQGSSEIISYLDETFPNHRLTPATTELRRQSLEWERYVDEEIGDHVRRCIYHGLLERPDIVVPFFSDHGSWYGKMAMRVMFPKIKARMRQLMNINESTARQSRKKLNIAVNKINTHLQKHKYLAGDNFTRADLSAAAILAPLFMPVQYGLNWPEKVPEEIKDLTDEFQERIVWAENIYTQYR